MHSIDNKSTSTELPFARFSEFQAGHESRRFLVGMNHRLAALARAVPLSDATIYLLLILSPFILGIALCAYGIVSNQVWFFLALPVAWVDYRTSTGAMNLFRMLFWLPLALLGWIIVAFFPFLGFALIVIGSSFVFTSCLCCAGLGMAKMDLESRVSESESAFRSAYASGLIFFVDSATGTIHERYPRTKA